MLCTETPLVQLQNRDLLLAMKAGINARTVQHNSNNKWRKAKRRSADRNAKKKENKKLGNKKYMNKTIVSNSIIM